MPANSLSETGRPVAGDWWTYSCIQRLGGSDPERLGYSVYIYLYIYIYIYIYLYIYINGEHFGATN